MSLLDYFQHRTHPIIQVVEGMSVLENLQHLTITKTFMKVVVANNDHCHIFVVISEHLTELLNFDYVLD